MKKAINFFCAWVVIITYFVSILWATYNGCWQNKTLSFVILLGWISLFAFLIIFCPFLFPISPARKAQLTNQEIFEHNHRVRLSLISILGVVSVLSGIYFSWEGLNVSRINIELTQKAALANFDQGYQKDINSIYSQSLINLSNKNFLVRLGAIFALEKIARSDPGNFYWPTIHIMTSYLQQHYPAKNVYSRDSQLKEDATSILEFIKEGKYDNPHSVYDRVDLSNTNLSYGNLDGADLSFANFNHSILRYVSFSHANLNNATFLDAKLEFARFTFADLSASKFDDAVLKGSTFIGADLSGSQFYKVSFVGSEWAWLLDAKLSHADFCRKYDIYSDTDLKQCALGLKCKDLKLATVSDETVLPEYLKTCNLHRIVDPEKIAITKVVNFISHGDYKNASEVQGGYTTGRLIYARKSSLYPAGG